jgi:hypothetical protein
MASGGHGSAIAQNPAESLPRATIRVNVFDPFGESIKAPNIYLYTRDRTQNFAKNSKASVITEVPYGSYLLVVASSGGGVGQRLISVNTPDLLVRIGVSMPIGDALWPGGDLAITGRIKPVPQDTSKWWIRVEGVFLNERREAAVQDNGTFRVGGLEMGRYLVQVFQGPELRDVRSIEIDPNTPVTEFTMTVER